MSAQLNIREQQFDFVDRGGQYIFKPQTAEYLEVPENEDLTMRVARVTGIEESLHALLYGRDRQLNYFIRRFDRGGRNDKVHVEDFTQLAGLSRETTYQSSMEQVAGLIDIYCTIPAVARLKLFRLILFCLLIGNEDMHLNNLDAEIQEKN